MLEVQRKVSAGLRGLGLARENPQAMAELSPRNEFSDVGGASPAAPSTSVAVFAYIAPRAAGPVNCPGGGVAPGAGEELRSLQL
jgi:hypothetical protein